MHIDENSDNASLPNNLFNEHDPYLSAFFEPNLSEGIIIKAQNENEINQQNNIQESKDPLSNNGQINLYADNTAQINDENFNIENVVKATNKDENNNSKIIKDNKMLDLLQNKSTTCHIDEINGKKIITSNNMCDKIFNEYFGTNEINIPTIKEMQMIKKKKKRRTREEIENDKKNENHSVEKVKKNMGRRKKDMLENDNEKSKHSKNADDNITKKINSCYIGGVYSWLNKSFLDSSNLNFQDENLKKKLNDNYFLKLDAKLIANTIKRKLIMKIMGQKFKDIFSTIPISSKYKKLSKTNNKDLVEKIYKENNQPFVIYILDMTFLDGLNYFNGQISDENIFNHFKDKFNKDLIQKFINNFGKIHKLFDKVYKEYDGKYNTNEIQDYMTQIKLLSLNYKRNFENKFDRGEKIKNDNEANEN